MPPRKAPSDAKPSASKPIADADLEEISFYLGRAYYNYVALLQRILCDLGLDAHLQPGMGHVLFVLYEQDDRIIKDLVERASLSPSTLTGMLTKMERAGVVKRHRDKADGRAVRVRLTPLARSLKPRCKVVLHRVNEVLGGAVGPQDLTRIKRGLARMIESMRADEERWRERAARK